MSPALAGRSLTTLPLGKSHHCLNTELSSAFLLRVHSPWWPLVAELSVLRPLGDVGVSSSVIPHSLATGRGVGPSP